MFWHSSYELKILISIFVLGSHFEVLTWDVYEIGSAW